MKQQINLLRLAILFYSRIPAGNPDYSEEKLRKAFRFFPLVGIIVGALGGGLFLLSGLVFPSTIAVVIAVTSMVLITGALHEDGLTDFVDGFGGGRDKEKILAIMKESTIGTYGVITLILLFLMKFTLLLSVDPASFVVVLIAAHASSRMMPIFLVNSSGYARSENSKAMHTRRKTDKSTFIIALLFALIPMIFIPWQIFAATVVIYAIILLLLKKYSEKKIGGFTGDVLGALQQFSELSFYLVWVAIYPILS